MVPANDRLVRRATGVVSRVNSNARCTAGVVSLVCGCLRCAGLCGPAPEGLRRCAAGLVPV